MPTVRPFGDCAFLLQWASVGYSESTSARALAISAHLRSLGVFTEVIPGYDSVMVGYDPLRMSLTDAGQRISAAIPDAPDTAPPGTHHTVTVDYSGPDLDALAEHAGLSRDEVVHIHSREPYRVCMIGFIPGFAFLSAVDPCLRHPRHASPRAHVPAGSVGIAGWQTGIYGLDSPGGWQILGCTDSVMFAPDRAAPFLLNAGDTVQFVPA